jgi:hypothetical protein
MDDSPAAEYRSTLAGLLAGVTADAPCRESARGESHDWLVFTTYLKPVSIGVFCRRCGCDGMVQKPTRRDWERAYDAPARPYRWHSGHLVRFINRRLAQWRDELAELDEALRQDNRPPADD